jgi:hypothetical protein
VRIGHCEELTISEALFLYNVEVPADLEHRIDKDHLREVNIGHTDLDIA